MFDQPWFLITLGAVAGANARYLVAVWAARRFGTAFPYGTLIANVAGSALLGFVATRLAGLPGGSETQLLVATGFLGSYTTFSTFAFESAALLREHARRRAVINLGATVVLGVAGAWLGAVLATRV